MYYDLITEMLGFIRTYEEETGEKSPNTLAFGKWLNQHLVTQGYPIEMEPEWVGKSTGRSADSVINTALVHLYRYAKLQAKAAIANTSFSTPDDFIYLINLATFGSMSKTALIKLNVHEKSAGMQIVNRLIENGLLEQTAIDSDKRNRMLHITPEGSRLLNESMDNIRQASKNVTEPLSNQEKLDLITLLAKLEKFHEEKWHGGK